MSPPSTGAAAMSPTPGWASGVPVAGTSPMPGWLISRTMGLASRAGSSASFGERAVALPQHRRAGEGLRDLGQSVPGEPRREQCGDHLPVPVAVAFVGEAAFERLFQPAERLGEPGDPGQVREVPRGEGHDHDEVATVRLLKSLAKPP